MERAGDGLVVVVVVGLELVVVVVELVVVVVVELELGLVVVEAALPPEEHEASPSAMAKLAATAITTRGWLMVLGCRTWSSERV
ncbi:MAG: hypothetical protein ACRDZ5_02240 [Acidimicrobiales bacterium]